MIFGLLGRGTEFLMEREDRVLYGVTSVFSAAKRKYCKRWAKWDESAGVLWSTSSDSIVPQMHREKSYSINTAMDGEPLCSDYHHLGAHQLMNG
jgi:hypothetical protein